MIDDPVRQFGVRSPGGFTFYYNKETSLCLLKIS